MSGNEQSPRGLPDGVRRRGSTFTAYWWAKDPATGAWKQYSSGGHRTQTEAKRFRTDKLAEVQRGTFVEPRDKQLTLRVFLADHWLPAARTEATRSGAPRRPTTIATYENAVRWEPDRPALDDDSGV